MIVKILSAGHVRLILRIYFIVTMAITAWLAEKVLNSRAKLQVIKTRSVPVNRALGWIQGFVLLKAVWSLRQLPGGKIGYLAMVFVFSLSKLADLITTSLVQQVPIQSRCEFGDGLIFNETGPALFTFPPVNGAPYIVVHNSQYFSTYNSCPYGIYTKVNRDTHFCPEEQDMLGTWSCTSETSLTYSAGYFLPDIATDLQNRGLLYSNISAISSDFGDGYYGHAVVWSSSLSDSSDTVWDVRAAIQTNDSPYDNVVMLPVSCSMNAPNAETIQSQMESVTSLGVWKATFQGLMYYGTGTPIVQDPEQELAMLLNTMVMVYGGNNMLLTVPAPNAYHTQGCIVSATHIPLVVEALVLIIAALLVILTVLLTSYALRLWAKDRVLKVATNDLPDTVVAWATLAAKEHQLSKQAVATAQVRQKELKNWVVGLEVLNGHRRLRIMRKGAMPDESPLQDGGNASERGLLATTWDFLRLWTK